MSYYSGAIPYTYVGNGTLTANAGSSTVTVTRNAGTLSGDLVVMVVYAQGDITGFTNIGVPWVWLDGGYDSVNGFGIGMFGYVNAITTATGDGLTLPASMAWTAHNATFRPLRGLQFDLSNVVRSNNWFNASASATALTRPAFSRGAGGAHLIAQGIELTAGGYNNGGTTTTVGTATNWPERFDTGQVSPPHGVTLCSRSVGTTIDHYSTVGHSLAVAKTMRAGCRAYIPIINNVQNRLVSLSGRRMR